MIKKGNLLLGIIYIFVVVPIITGIIHIIIRPDKGIEQINLTGVIYLLVFILFLLLMAVCGVKMIFKKK